MALNIRSSGRRQPCNMAKTSCWKAINPA
jgi:hypothetical protein